MSDYAAQQATIPTIPWPGEATLEFYAARLLHWANELDVVLSAGNVVWQREIRQMAYGLQQIAWSGGRAEPPQETT